MSVSKFQAVSPTPQAYLPSLTARPAFLTQQSAFRVGSGFIVPALAESTPGQARGTRVGALGQTWGRGKTMQTQIAESETFRDRPLRVGVLGYGSLGLSPKKVRSGRSQGPMSSLLRPARFLEAPFDLESSASQPFSSPSTANLCFSDATPPSRARLGIFEAAGQ
jgi:hypothetical protein